MLEQPSSLQPESCFAGCETGTRGLTSWSFTAVFIVNLIVSVMARFKNSFCLMFLPVDKSEDHEHAI